jgi:hypothetical protein
VGVEKRAVCSCLSFSLSLFEFVGGFAAMRRRLFDDGGFAEGRRLGDEGFACDWVQRGTEGVFVRCDSVTEKADQLKTSWMLTGAEWSGCGVFEFRYLECGARPLSEMYGFDSEVFLVKAEFGVVRTSGCGW